MRQSLQLLFLGSLLTLGAKLTAQPPDSSFQKKQLNTTEVSAFFSLYTQEGRHSAVTGGEGDEQLDVYHTGASIAQGIGPSLVLFDAGVDIISSPSTDRIDYVMSSPSAHDAHVQARLGYQYHFKTTQTKIGAAYRWGMESDYWSDGFSLWWTKVSTDQTRAWSLVADVFIDDLRWGFLNAQANFRRTRLVYPVELRGTDWFDIHHRHSYNFNANVRQDINRRLRLNLGLGLTYQQGLLSTPFHRVYFQNTTDPKVENLPRQRWRIPISAAVNWFYKPNLVLQPSYRFYWDNFGIWAQTLTLQAAIKPSAKLSLYPFFRGYYQQGATFFASYGEHLITATFYTSDYDYATFFSLKTGIGMGWYPDHRLGKKARLFFNNLIVRYAFFYRSDGLSAHIISLQVGLKQ